MIDKRLELVRERDELQVNLDKRHAKISELRASVAMLSAGWRTGAKYYQESPEVTNAVLSCADAIDELLEKLK